MTLIRFASVYLKFGVTTRNTTLLEKNDKKVFLNSLAADFRHRHRDNDPDLIL